MGTSAFDILIVPVFWATLGGYLAGATILIVMNAVAALVGRLGRPSHPPGMALRAARDSRRRDHRAIARGVGSIG
jgi:hypothetical protein